VCLFEEKPMPTREDEIFGAGRQIQDAPKDRTRILAYIRGDLVAFESRRDLDRWAGRFVVLDHPGITDDGYDFGWNVAAPVGSGGIPDRWIDCWWPLPSKVKEAKTEGAG
jgi:hypothetical protein